VPAVPYAVVAKLLGLAKGTVGRHGRQYRANTPPSNAGPVILSHAERDDLVPWINTAYIDRRPWMITEITARIECVDWKSMDANTIRNILRRDLGMEPGRG
jgi:hypothetical protein